MCRRCYNYAYNHNLLDDINRKRRPREEYFFEKVDARGVCWIWTSPPDRDGYGQFHDGTTQMAHRWCWEFLVGPIPRGMTLDHLCRNKLCVMPDHLEVVTDEENTDRYLALVGRQRKYRGLGENVNA